MGLRVLVIDSDRESAEHIRAIVNACGHTCVVAGNAGWALSCAELTRPDLLLVAPVLDDGNGLELLRRIKALPTARRAPVMLLTRLNEPTTVLRAYAAWGAEPLRRPIDPAVLRARLALADRAHRLSQDLERVNQALQRGDSRPGEPARGRRVPDPVGLSRYELMDLLTTRQRSLQYGGVPVGYIIVDLDPTSSLEQQLGHEGSDELRRDLVQILRQQLRSSDLVARHGPDQLAIVLPGANPLGARTVAAKIRATLERLGLFETTDGTQPLIGVSCFDLGRHRPAYMILADGDESLAAAEDQANGIAMLRPDLPISPDWQTA